MELSNDISALKDLVSVLLRRIEVLESENVALRAEVAELRSRLDLNSKNSHKPPSSDGLSKKPGLPKDSPKKIGRLMGDLWGCTFNESTALAANAGMYEALHPVEEQIKAAVLDSEVAHFDETGMRVEKKLHWFHVASTALFTYLFVHKKRGKEALESEASLLMDFTKRAVHDCRASYFDFEQCQHALCGAHLLRELTNLAENAPGHSGWASQMHRFVLKLYQASQKGTVPVADRQTWVRQFEQICHWAGREEPPPKQGKRGKPKNSKGRNLLNRLVKHQDEWLAFAFEQNVPFTNNQAGRDIRCLKTKQKVATNFQTLKGAQHYARIQAFTSTLRKHSMNVFHNLIDAFDRKTIVFQTG